MQRQLVPSVMSLLLQSARRTCHSRISVRWQHDGVTQPRILSSKFSLDDEWSKRAQRMQQYFELSSDPYDLIVVAKKKFVSGGKASAVDVDVAVTMANEKDQLEEVVDLAYKLRHTNNAADLLPSTEYAIFRLLMRYQDTASIFKIINDPINYGLFLNVHAACLLLDHLLSEGNVQGATKVATVLMQQEMFDSLLLNLISLYALHKWEQLPEEAKKFSEDIQPPTCIEEAQEEEIKTMKFPFLKNEWDDGHFDMVDEGQLVTKANKWFIRALPPELKRHFPPSSEEKTSSFWSWADEPLLSIKRTEEETIMEEQRREFDRWDARKKELLITQAAKTGLRKALEKVAIRRREIAEEKELLFFFENRLQWEDEAKNKDALFEEFGLDKKDTQLTEKEYAESIFERARTMLEGSVQKSK